MTAMQEERVKIIFELASKVYNQLFGELENLQVNIHLRDDNCWDLKFMWGSPGRYWATSKCIPPAELYSMQRQSYLIDIIADGVCKNLVPQDLKN